MRRALALGSLLVLGLVAVEPAAATGTTQLVTNSNPTRFGRTIQLTVTALPTDPAEPRGGLEAEIRRADGHLLASGTTAADGTFAVAVEVRRTASYVGLVRFPGDADFTASAALRIRVIPILRGRVYGDRIVGASLVLRGRMFPATAGKLRLRLHGETRRVRVGQWGHFKAPLPTRTVAVLRALVRVVPNTGYTGTRREWAVALRRPYLAYGSRSVAVRALERRLRGLHHVLKSRPDSHFGIDTYQAVVAFQKVHGLARTGRVGDAIWRGVTNARVPRAYIASGTHIEVSKKKQMMYEVVRGEVKRIMHVSTGATGNTPVGDWRVYRLGPGGSLSGMYYSIYFLRGFAIHGYHSVPTYPASHGCVRTPLWFARSFYNRWGRIGVRIVVFP